MKPWLTDKQEIQFLSAQLILSFFCFIEDTWAVSYLIQFVFRFGMKGPHRYKKDHWCYLHAVVVHAYIPSIIHLLLFRSFFHFSTTFWLSHLCYCNGSSGSGDIAKTLWSRCCPDVKQMCPRILLVVLDYSCLLIGFMSLSRMRFQKKNYMVPILTIHKAGEVLSLLARA